ncbi:hypothetical protein DRE_03420 [Drechslerella stenobrocha 248]|uniref:Aminoglycoside phosphotransferase domain-containing protein n=1 Tax=Drechslerella stenobrocha 248 TaxID=1043628 RepID=W7HT81_9PEZI|nr:hypothetical protein DRE_03420 [Drechslerella stenobrocha 248]
MAETPTKLAMLKSTEQVLEYLSVVAGASLPERFRNPTSIIQLTTGLANGIHRLVLSAPLSNTNIGDGPRTVILKHSTPHIIDVGGKTVVWDLWPYDLRALREVPNTERVKTPKVYWVDETNRVVIIEDAGPESRTLKDVLLSDTIPSVGVFRQIGDELGKYLAQLHTWGSSPEVMSRFENKDARVIASWRTVGRVEDEVEKACPDIPQDVKTALKTWCDKEKEKAMNGVDTVIMGDFWTGNVLVNLTAAGELESLYVVDWEMVRPADAAVELSQMLAEVWEAGQFGRSTDAKAAAKDLAVALCSAYEHGARMLPENMLRDVMVGAGAHVAVWAEFGFTKQITTEACQTAKRKAGKLIQEALTGGTEGGQASAWGLAGLDKSTKP